MPKRKSASTKKYTRPGVEAVVHFLSLPLSSHRWNEASTHYQGMLQKKGGRKLVDLDRRRAALVDNTDKCLTKEQLLDIIIPWKFTKGKPRHALNSLLQSNTETSVQNISKRAVEIATSATTDNSQQCIKEAMDELCNLKGVGPATASAILSIFHPNLFVFMDDELIEALYDGKRGYTFKIYEVVNEKCEEICKKLNQESEKVWNRCEVGKVLWTMAALKALGEEEILNDLLDDVGGDVVSLGKKRKK